MCLSVSECECLNVCVSYVVCVCLCVIFLLYHIYLPEINYYNDFSGFLRTEQTQAESILSLVYPVKDGTMLPEVWENSLKSLVIGGSFSSAQVSQRHQARSSSLASFQSVMKLLCKDQETFLSNSNMFVHLPRVNELLEDDKEKFNIPHDSSKTRTTCAYVGWLIQ